MSKFKILTLAEMKKNEEKMILEESIKSIHHYIFSGVNGGLPHVDLPFTCHNKRDVDVFEKLVKAFRAKKWDIKELVREPVSHPTPMGAINFTRIVFRVQLKKPTKEIPLALASRQPGEQAQ